jgi:hypothetical protein
MKNDDQSIEPALTPENWRRLEKFPFFVRDGRLFEWIDVGAVAVDQLEGVIALANAALPNDSPYKITRADVEHLQQFASEERSAILERLADKLKTLLPPKEGDAKFATVDELTAGKR